MPIEASPDPERQAFARELAVLIERAVDRLGDGYREVFMLRQVEGLSTAETAQVLDVSEDVVKTRLSRARAALQRDLLEHAGAAAASAFTFGLARCDRVVAAVMSGITTSLMNAGFWVPIWIEAEAVFPRASLAMAISVWVSLPRELVSHGSRNGGVVSTPISAPSTRNSTAITPMLSEAVAAIVVTCETVEEFAGAVIETVGGIESGSVEATGASMSAWISPWVSARL